MPITTKLGRMVTYQERLSTIESHDPLVMFFVKSRDKLKSSYLQQQNAY